MIRHLCWALLFPALAVAQEPPNNVLLITVDNLRPANMGVYGYERNTTPFLSAIAEECAVFDSAWSTSAWTSPGMSSFFTGYWPPTHAQSGQHSWWDPTLPTAIKEFTRQDYRATGRSNSGPTYANLGFQYQTYPYADLEEFIDNRSIPDLLYRPFYGWMHLKDVHLPYNKGTAYYRRQFGADGEPTDAVRAALEQGVVYVGQPGIEFTEQDQQVVRGLYDAAVAHADERLAGAFEQLEQSGLRDRTLVIISADHGEEQFEHGWLGHASTSWDGKLFDESWHIPMMACFPNGEFAGRYPQMVQQLDVMPTLTDWLGIRTDELVLPMQGSSLMPILRGETTQAPRAISFAQTTYKGWATPLEEMGDRLTAARSDTLKLLRYGGARSNALVGFDLVADPAERSPIDATADERFQPLIDAMQAWDAETQEGAATLAFAALDRQLARQEEALRDGDVRVVMQAYSDLLLLDQTFRGEVMPFMDETRWRRSYERKLAKARANVARAVRP